MASSCLLQLMAVLQGSGRSCCSWAWLLNALVLYAQCTQTYTNRSSCSNSCSTSITWYARESLVDPCVVLCTTLAATQQCGHQISRKSRDIGLPVSRTCCAANSTTNVICTGQWVCIWRTGWCTSTHCNAVAAAAALLGCTSLKCHPHFDCKECCPAPCCPPPCAQVESKAQVLKRRREAQHDFLYTLPVQASAGQAIELFYNPDLTPLRGRPEIYVRGSFNR